MNIKKLFCLYVVLYDVIFLAPFMIPSSYSKIEPGAQMLMTVPKGNALHDA